MDKKVYTFCLNFFEKDDYMLSVGRRQIDALREVGLLKDKKTGLNVQDPNYTVLNKFHKARAKTYAVVETPEILAFLECWDRCNLQEITTRQFNQLVDERRLNESDIQRSGEYVERALCFVSRDGRYFVQKVAKLLIPIGVWRSKGAKNY